MVTSLASHQHPTVVLLVSIMKHIFLGISFSDYFTELSL